VVRNGSGKKGKTAFFHRTLKGSNYKGVFLYLRKYGHVFGFLLNFLNKKKKEPNKGPKIAQMKKIRPLL